MPLDRRRRGALRHLFAFLPWSTQNTIGHAVYPWSPLWPLLIAVLVTVVVGPWPVTIVALAWVARRAWRSAAQRLERRARVRTGQPAERALWVVPMRSARQLRMMAKTGFWWLPASAPLMGGDIFLIDFQARGHDSPPQIAMAGRLANPLFRTPRRRRRLVRLGALWSLAKPLTLEELPELKAAWTSPRPEIRSLDYSDEERAMWRDRLEAETSIREPRKANWRAERKAIRLFHKLWGIAHDADSYEKPVWSELQGALQNVGVPV